MEANRKLRGYVKGKLMSFYRTAKPSSTVQYTNASIKFLVQQDNCVFAQPKQKVSFIVQDNNRDLMTSYDNICGVPGDEPSIRRLQVTYLPLKNVSKLEQINLSRNEICVKKMQ